jgi:multisubunit Na+/H+ antiporter MnhB subunit
MPGETAALAAPPTSTVEGPAFSFGVKLLAGAMMLGLAGYGARAFAKLLSQPGSLTAVALMAVAIACLALYYGWMLRSRTGIGPTHLHQTWIRPKRVALAEITQLKLIFVPGLAWLISPRLVVRTRAPGSIVFHAADPKVLEAIARLALRQLPLR